MDGNEKGLTLIIILVISSFMPIVIGQPANKADEVAIYSGEQKQGAKVLIGCVYRKKGLGSPVWRHRPSEEPYTGGEVTNTLYTFRCQLSGDDDGTLSVSSTCFFNDTAANITFHINSLDFNRDHGANKWACELSSVYNWLNISVTVAPDSVKYSACPDSGSAAVEIKAMVGCFYPTQLYWCVQKKDSDEVKCSDMADYAGMFKMKPKIDNVFSTCSKYKKNLVKSVTSTFTAELPTVDVETVNIIFVKIGDESYSSSACQVKSPLSNPPTETTAATAATTATTTSDVIEAQVTSCANPVSTVMGRIFQICWIAGLMAVVTLWLY